jgi:FAD/FMN-containing dehydrogenase
MEALLTAMKREGIPREHAEEAREFQEHAFGMLKNNEVTEDEARELVRRARELLAKLDPAAIP